MQFRFRVTNRIVNSLSTYYGYRPTLQDGEPNPQTKEDFVLRRLSALILDQIAQAEGEAAREAAKTKVRDEISLNPAIDANDP